MFYGEGKAGGEGSMHPQFTLFLDDIYFNFIVLIISSIHAKHGYGKIKNNILFGNGAKNCVSICFKLYKLLNFCNSTIS